MFLEWAVRVGVRPVRFPPFPKSIRELTLHSIRGVLMKKSLPWLGLLAAGLVFCASPQTSLAQGYGHVTGQFVLQGDMPNIPLAKLGDKDREVCVVNPPHPEETLIVDAKTKGIANIVVYLKKAPSKIHPALKASKVKTVVFDQKNCRFEPHLLLVRTDQEVLVKSDDPINHNTHTHPFRNQELNFLVRPNDRAGVPIKYDQPEFLPTPVNCDLHPHMKAYWLILDHPYMALTDAEGKFKIENLPEGDYDFTVWQERVGYIEKALAVTIEPGATEELGKIDVPASKIKLD
jgi:Polysaccharide lyase family 4, domain II